LPRGGQVERKREKRDRPSHGGVPKDGHLHAQVDKEGVLWAKKKKKTKTGNPSCGKPKTRRMLNFSSISRGQAVAWSLVGVEPKMKNEDSY